MLIHNICFDLDQKCHPKRERTILFMSDSFSHNRMINLLILLEFAINHFYLHMINEMYWNIIQHHKKQSHLTEIHINDMPWKKTKGHQSFFDQIFSNLISKFLWWNIWDIHRCIIKFIIEQNSGYTQCTNHMNPT